VSVIFVNHNDVLDMDDASELELELENEKRKEREER